MFVAGNFDWWHIKIHNCQKTDTTLACGINNWQLTLYRFDHEKNNYFVVDSGSDIPTIVTLDVIFPSGKLLIADWFRIKQFSDAVEREDRWDIPSISSELGRQPPCDIYSCS
jgi:hypothetical protein